MSSTDTRIVQMQFDNKDWEKNIGISQDSLEKFKDELDFDVQEKNLRNFGDAAKRLSFESLVDNIQKLADKFTGLGTVSELVLSQIRRGIEGCAAKVSAFVASMTTDQITAGMSKYEQLSKNVQTIMAATGRAQEDVYKVLQRLNEYTDQTSYNFTDMANNIGKFTSVGISLEAAERQMEGIANWAARSGAGINEASRAMYNLSQAMGVGKLTLIDWKSIENAGMATKEFKQQLIDAAIAAGTLVATYDKAGNRTVKTAKSLGKQVDVTYKNINSTLNKGWANTEVMGKTLEKYYYEDLYYEGKIAAGVETTREQRDEIRSALAKNNKLTVEDWDSLGLASDEAKQKAIDAAVAQKKLLKEVNEEGYTVYKTLAKNGKQIEISLNNFEEFVKSGLLDASLADVLFNLNDDALMEISEKQKDAVRKALGDDDAILKKDWVEGMKEQGLATDEVKQAAIDAAVATKNLEKVTTKDGRTIYKTAKKYGNQVEVTLENFDETLKMKWFDADVSDKVFKLNALGKASYEAAQKCLTFSDVLGAWKDQISTGWMNSYRNVFGDLSEAMLLFSTICNKVGEAIDDLIQTRNKILEAWGNNGGRNTLWGLIIGEYNDGEETVYEGAYGLLDVLLKVGEMLQEGFWNMIKTAIPTDAFEKMIGTDLFKNMFPEFEGMSFDDLWEQEDFKETFVAFQIDQFVQKVQEWLHAVKAFFEEIPEGAAESRLSQIQNIVNGLFGAVLLLYTIGKKVGAFIVNFIAQFKPSGDAVLALLSQLGITISDTAHEASTGSGLTDFFATLLAVTKPFADAINTVIEKMTGFIGKVIESGQESGTFAKILTGIGDLFTKVIDLAAKLVSPVIDFLGSIFDVINILFSEGINEQSMKKVGATLEQALSNLFSGIFNAFGDDLGKKLKDFFAYVFGFVEEDAGESMEGSSKTIVGVIKQWLRKIFGIIGTIFSGFRNENGDISLFRLIKEDMGLGKLNQFLSELGKMLQGAQLYQLVKLFGVLVLIFHMIKTFKNAAGMFKNVRAFFGGLGDSLKEGFKLDVTDKTESMGEKILQIAKGIALIAGAVAVLGSMQLGALAKGVGAVAAIMGLLFGFFYLMKKQVTGMGLAEIVGLVGSIGIVGLGISGMAISIGLLMLALKPYSKMKMEEIANMLFAFMGVITVLGLVAKYVASDLSGIKAKDMLSIAALGLGIGIMIKNLLPLAKMRLDQIINMMAGLGMILGELVVFAHFMDSASFGGKGLSSLIGMSLGIGVLILSLRTIADMDIFQLSKMGLALFGILAMLQWFSKELGTFKGAGLSSVIALALGIFVLIRALQPIADVPAKGLIKMGATLGAILLMLHMFNQGIGSYRLNEMAGVIAVAAAIWLLVRALMPLANVPLKGLIKMIAGLAGILLMLHLFLERSQALPITAGITNLLSMIGLAAVIGMFGLAMSAAKDLRWEQIAAMCLGLMAVLIVYASVLEIINNNQNAVMKGTHALIAMAGLAVVMFTFSMAMNEIRNINVDKILAFSLGLSALIAAMALAMKLTQGMPIGGAIKSILIIAAAVAAMIAVISLLMPMLAGSIADSIQMIITRLTLTSRLFTDFITSMSSFSEGEVESAKRKFELIFELLASLKDASAYYSSIEAFSTSLLMLGAGISVFNTLTADIPDPEKSMAIKTVRTILGLKDQISAFTLNNLDQKLQSLGSGIGGFITNSSDVTTTEPQSYTLLKKLLNCRNEINAFAKLNLDGFTHAIQGLGGALSLYAMGAKEVGGIEEGELTDVEAAVGIMEAISTSLSEKGGFKIPDIPKESELGTFPSDLAALANAVVAFTNACEAFDDGRTGNALAALGFLGTMNGYLTEDTLKVVDVTKDISFTTMGRFSLDIRSLGGALKDFCDTTKDIGDTSDAVKALEFFAGLQDKLTDSAMAAIFVFDNNNVDPDVLGAFALDIVALGGALQDFANNTHFDADTTTTFDNAVAALDALVDIQNKLPDVGGVVQWWEGHKMDFTTLGTDVATMGSGLAVLSSALSGNGEDGQTYNSDIVNSALAGLRSITEIINLLSYIPEDKLNNGFSYATTISNLMETLADTMDSTDKYGNYLRNNPVVENLVSLMSQISTSIGMYEEESGEIDENAINMFARMAEGISALMNVDPSLDFKWVGTNVSRGIAEGITAGTIDVTEAAKNVILAAKEQAMKTADENSPSKVFAAIGEFLSIGLAQGITDAANSPEKAAEGLINSAVDSAEGPLALLSKLLTDGIDLNPTITPVLDLSNVTTGMQNLNGMFGTSYGMTLDPNIAATIANSSMPAPAETMQTQVDLTSVNSQLQALQDELSAGLDRLAQMKVILDSGILAGALTDQIDINLGRKSFYAGRLN